MKRSEMIMTIAKALKDDWYEKNGPKLKGSSYVGFSIADGYKLAEIALSTVEKAGMLPPRIQLTNFGVGDNAWEQE